MAKQDFKKGEDCYEVMLETENGLAAVLGKVGEEEITMVLDTGAGVSLIREQFVETEIRPIENVRVRAVNGGDLDLKGNTTVAVQIGELSMTHDMIVVQRLPVPMILGNDFNAKFGLNIDFGNREVTVRCKEYMNKVPLVLTRPVEDVIQLNIEEGPPKKRIKVRVARDIKLPAFSVCPVSVNIDEKEELVGIIHTNLELKEKRRVYSTAKFMNFTNQETVVEVANPSFDAQVLGKGTCIGYVAKRDEDETDRTRGNGKLNPLAAPFIAQEKKDCLTAQTIEDAFQEELLDINPELSRAEKEKIVHLLREYADTIAFKPEQMGRAKGFEGTIDTGGAPPVH